MSDSLFRSGSPVTAAAIALPRYAFLAVEGVNTGKFLQGQLSCNIADAGPLAAIPGAYCTPKGRVIANFLLWQESPERVLLRLRADILTDTQAVLTKYGVFSKVRIAPAEPARHVIGLIGEAVAAALGSRIPHWPDRMGALTALDGAVLLQRDAQARVHELWVVETAVEHWRKQLADVSAGNDDLWNETLITHGAAEIQTATRDQFLPQMLAYDKTGAVNFRKGCYTGQEIVARTHYKGAVKRHLQRLAGECPVAPAAGTELTDESGQRAVGTVIESAITGAGTIELLAVVADESFEGGLIRLNEQGSQVLRALPQPCAML
jgi:tRNA-modifying protein YgfZ